MNASEKRRPPKKSKPLRWVLAGIIVATLIVVATVFIMHRRLPVDPQGAAAWLKAGDSDLALRQIRHTATRNGRDEWTLTAKSAKVLPHEKRTVIEDPSVVFFLKDGEKVYLKARKGILKTETNDLEALGDVVVTYEAYVMKTQRLRYNHRKRRISSRVPVRIKGERFSLSADRMVYDLNSKISKFKGNIESTIHERLSL